MSSKAQSSLWDSPQLNNVVRGVRADSTSLRISCTLLLLVGWRLKNVWSRPPVLSYLWAEADGHRGALQGREAPGGARTLPGYRQVSNLVLLYPIVFGSADRLESRDPGFLSWIRIWILHCDCEALKVRHHYLFLWRLEWCSHSEVKNTIDFILNRYIWWNFDQISLEDFSSQS